MQPQYHTNGLDYLSQYVTMGESMVFVLESPTLNDGFGAWLRAAREKRGIEQEDLAAVSGMGQSTISMYERGKRNPRRDTVILLSDALSTDDETEEDRDNRRNSALLAAGFVPEGGGLPEMTRNPADPAVHLYTGLSEASRREASAFIEFLWDRERRRREGDPVEELEDEGDD